MSKRYSESDKQKYVQDKLADFRAKGIDARKIHSLVPGGSYEAVKQLSKDIPYVRDQSQEQTEKNRKGKKK